MKSSDVPHLRKAKAKTEHAAAQAEVKTAHDEVTRAGASCAIEGCSQSRAKGSEWCEAHTTRLSRLNK